VNLYAGVVIPNFQMLVLGRSGKDWNVKRSSGRSVVQIGDSITVMLTSY
jgi:hypothetical protein